MGTHSSCLSLFIFYGEMFVHFLYLFIYLFDLFIYSFVCVFVYLLVATYFTNMAALPISGATRGAEHGYFRDRRLS